ncbi:MAG: SIMPL domain-containing protein [Verrucomicrobiota bacterium]|jgi:hypothetical protein
MITVRSFVVLGLSLIAGLAIFGHQIGRAVKNGREFDRYLTVRGLSEREMKATVAIWPIQFATYAEDLGALKSAMERDRALVIAFLTNNGVETKEMTQGLPDVIDRQDARIRDKSPTLSRYQGLMTLVVRSPHVDVVKKAIQGADALLEKGVALAGNGYFQRTQFLFDAVNEVKPDMIKEATANARAAAEKFAEDSHSKVGRIRRATQGTVEIEDLDVATPEKKIIRVVTTVDFFLE